MGLGWREEIREGFLEKVVFWWALTSVNFIYLLHLLSLLIKT